MWIIRYLLYTIFHLPISFSGITNPVDLECLHYYSTTVLPLFWNVIISWYLTAKQVMMRLMMKRPNARKARAVRARSNNSLSANPLPVSCSSHPPPDTPYPYMKTDRSESWTVSFLIEIIWRVITEIGEIVNRHNLTAVITFVTPAVIFINLN